MVVLSYFDRRASSCLSTVAYKFPVLWLVVPAPTLDFSRTTHCTPALDNSNAVVKPVIPPPIMATSAFIFLLSEGKSVVLENEFQIDLVNIFQRLIGGVFNYILKI